MLTRLCFGHAWSGLLIRNICFMCDSANDQCSFLLNSSLLSGVFALMAFATSVYVGCFLSIHFRVLRICWLVFLRSSVAWFFYTASLLNVTRYGNIIRSSYDLFRFNLLEKLHLNYQSILMTRKNYGAKFLNS